MKAIFLTMLILTPASVNAASSIVEKIDSAYWAFLKAKGEPSLLATGKEGEFANVLHRPLPSYKEIDLNYEQAILGHDLFQDKSLSLDGSIACSTCHNGRAGGGDGKKVAIGINGLKGEVNVPTVFNSGFNFRLFWDGRAFDLTEQAEGPVENPIEMAHNWENLIKSLEQSNYRKRFENLYPDGVTRDNATHAIAQLERGLIVNGAPYERYLKGERSALSAQALNGLKRFTAYGCVACHNGINLGGNLYHRFTAKIPDGNAPTSILNGVFARSGREKDKGLLKVPTLWNIARSAPYLHNGEMPHLDTLIEQKIRYYTGRHPTEQEIEDIEVFLKSLTGTMPPTIREIL